MTPKPCVKRRHLTRQSAERHLAQLRESGREKPGRMLHTYYCPECQSYHVGHTRRRNTP